jgi:putative aldouronate transport system permease protein
MKILQTTTTSSTTAISDIYQSADNNTVMVTPTSIRATMTIIASVPILMVYPFLQKYFVQGMTLGGVKG